LSNFSSRKLRFFAEILPPMSDMVRTVSGMRKNNFLGKIQKYRPMRLIFPEIKIYY